MQKKLLGKKSLGVLMAERLKNDILDGVWVDKLPGYRVLSSHYQVSDRTSRSAVDILEKQGIVEAPKQGKQRAILKLATPTTKRTLKSNLLIIQDSTIPLGRPVDHLFSEMIEFWLRRSTVGSDVKRVSGDLTRYKQPDRLLQQWVEKNDATHLLLFNASIAWVQAVDRLGLPCYYVGGSLYGAKIPLDRCQGASQRMDTTIKLVFERLRKMGHTRVFIPYEHTLTDSREKVLDAMISVYHDILTEDACEKLIPIFQEFNPESWRANWEKELLRLQPTVVIVTSYFALVSLYAYCARIGIRLGKDLMMLCLFSEDVLDWYYPRPTYMKYPYEKSLKDFKGWVRSGCPFREHTSLEMEWIDGETL